MTALYNLFSMHNVLPHEFYGVIINNMTRKLLLVFSSYEVEQNNKANSK